MKVRTTTGQVNPYALRASKAPMRAGTFVASSARGNNRHDARVEPPSLSSMKEGSTGTKLGR